MKANLEAGDAVRSMWRIEKSVREAVDATGEEFGASMPSSTRPRDYESNHHEMPPAEFERCAHQPRREFIVAQAGARNDDQTPRSQGLRGADREYRLAQFRSFRCQSLAYAARQMA